MNCSVVGGRGHRGPPNGSGVELRRPGTRLPDDITQQAGGREANPPATRRRHPMRGEAYDRSNTLLGGARAKWRARSCRPASIPRSRHNPRTNFRSKNCTGSCNTWPLHMPPYCSAATACSGRTRGRYSGTSRSSPDRNRDLDRRSSSAPSHKLLCSLGGALNPIPRWTRPPSSHPCRWSYTPGQTRVREESLRTRVRRAWCEAIRVEESGTLVSPRSGAHRSSVRLTRMALSCEGSWAERKDITCQRLGLERKRVRSTRPREKPSRRGRQHQVARQPSSASTPG